MTITPFHPHVFGLALMGSGIGLIQKERSDVLEKPIPLAPFLCTIPQKQYLKPIQHPCFST
ncbi:hypothetical protein CHH92_08005 [Bacillus sonorensis]|nr:hypothetical protein CHH92_08005 [Bacillus sonorensis]